MTTFASTGARRERSARRRAARRRGAEPRLRLPWPEGSGEMRVRGDRPLRGQLDLSHYVLQGVHNLCSEQYIGHLGSGRKRDS